MSLLYEPPGNSLAPFKLQTLLYFLALDSLQVLPVSLVNGVHMAGEPDPAGGTKLLLSAIGMLIAGKTNTLTLDVRF